VVAFDNFWNEQQLLRPVIGDKALQKAEYSDFCIFARFIPYIPYVRNLSCQNCFKIFAKYSFRLKFQLENSITSLERRALTGDLFLNQLLVVRLSTNLWKSIIQLWGCLFNNNYNINENSNNSRKVTTQLHQQQWQQYHPRQQKQQQRHQQPQPQQQQQVLASSWRQGVPREDLHDWRASCEVTQRGWRDVSPSRAVGAASRRWRHLPDGCRRRSKT